ncbi:blood group Rh(CE) polypeptide isoform X2 [Athene noctua]|uniref:blood group Rh(CE) polypeptide isoform X2 n=1 Tax=Athene noctua TaxID=126797 RepID=UPI003EBD7DBF
MPAHYRNFHNSVPWLILFLEVVFFVIFYFSDYDEEMSSISYPDFQDVNHMVIFGFGFFLTFLKRYGFSSTGFNLLIIVLGVQCSVVIEELLLFLPDWPRKDDMRRIVKASLSLTAVIISIGAVLGKTNPVQLSLMTVVEMVAFHMTRWMHTKFLQISDNISMMHAHLFGAYFGLAAASRFSEPLPGSEKNASTPKSDLLSMLVSTVTAFMLSALITKDGKFKMTHIHSAVLAGGVAVGYAAHSITYPWIAMILGLLASVITILGSYCLPRCLNPVLKIHDTSGVHFTFGLPSMLGALAHVVLLVIENWTDKPSLCSLVMIYIWAFFLTMDVALITGFITGFILNFKLFKTIPVSMYFEDQFYWEFPHLAVGF